jgi:serine/threonine protein kinase
MTIGSPRFFFNFTALELLAQRKGLAKKVLCTTLSIALLNASLSPVVAMPRRHQTNEAADVSTMRTDALKHPKKTSKKNRQKASQEIAQKISQEEPQEAVQTKKSAQTKPAESSDDGISGYASWFLKGFVDLVSRGISYVLKHPGEALVMGLAAQVAATNAFGPLTGEFRINQNTTGSQGSPSVTALNNSDAFVAWQGSQAGTDDIYGCVLAPIGTTLINELMINQNTAWNQHDPFVTILSNSNVFVVWQDDQAGTLDIYGRVLTPNGTALTNDFLINQNRPGFLMYPSVAALSNGNAFVTWHNLGDNIYGRVLTPNGTALTNEFLINQNTGGTQNYPTVAALNNGNAVVVWQGDQTGNVDIYGRVMTPNGIALTNDFLINQNTAGNQLYPTVAALGNGNAFVTWDNIGDIYGRVLTPNSTALTNDFLINQNTTGTQEKPSVTTLSNGNVFVVWQGDQAGTLDIYGRVLAPNGTALTNEFLINQNTTGNQEDFSVAALNNGKAFVVWEGTQTGTRDIYGRIFNLSDPLTTTGSQTTAGFQTTEMPLNPGSYLPLLGVGAAAVGLSIGGSLITACALGGLYGVKKCKKQQQKQPEKRTSSADPFAPTSLGFTEHPTFVGALKGSTYAIWKELSKQEVTRLQPQTAKPIPPFSSPLEKMPFFLGKGNFGATYAGSDIETGELYAIKEVYGRKAVDDSLREGEIQDKLNGSSQIMTLVDYKSYEPSNEKYNPNPQPRLFQVMSLAYTNGVGYKHLFSVLKEDSGHESSHEARVADNFQQLMKGIAYMHSKGIYHLDIKADNILYMGDGTLRIADFGRARDLGENAQLKDARMGDRRFYSPEQFALIRYVLDQNGEQIIAKEEMIDSFPAWAADAWQGGLYILELLVPKDHPLSAVVASYQTKLSSWTNATFENALKSISVLQEGSEKSFKGVLRGILAVNLKDRLKPDMVVKTLPSSIFLSPEKREEAFKNVILMQSNLKEEEISPVQNLYAFIPKEEDKNYTYGTPELSPEDFSNQEVANISPIILSSHMGMEGGYY